MAKRKPEPKYEAVYPPEYGVSGLFLELLDFSQSTNELGKAGDGMSTLILSAVSVAEADGKPMTADDIAFYFDIARTGDCRRLRPRRCPPSRRGRSLGALRGRGS